MTRRQRVALVPAFMICIVGFGSVSVEACAVPVFRYALERDSWQPAPYPVFLFHRGELEPQQRAVLKVLEQAQIAEAAYPANILVLAVDVAKPMLDSVKSLWEAVEPKSLPRLVVCMPVPMTCACNAYSLPPDALQADSLPPDGLQIVWSGEASSAMAHVLLDSPARREIQRKTAQGDAAVWVLLESGDEAKDDAAAELVRRQTEAFAKDFRFSPEAVEAMGLESADAARLAFSLVRVRRADPAEKMLVAMLLATEPDLKGFHEPMLFPVFGRGRVLGALVGKGITAENLQYACAYITGDCSCEIKEQNPGVDLLISADWYKVLAGVVPPPLPEAWAGMDASPEAESVRASSKTVRNLLVGAGILLLTVIVVSVVLRRRARKQGV